MQKTLILLTAILTTFGIVKAQQPNIFIKSNLYEKDGATNAFTLTLGAAPAHSGYVDVISDSGSQTEAEVITANFDQDNGALIATNISCQVGQEGWIKVFCDEGVIIDYLSITGAEVTSIEFQNPENIEILALEHNALESFDLTPFVNLSMLCLNDNPFTSSPLVDKGSKPNLLIMEIAQIENIDPNFDITGYPNLRSFDAMSTAGLMKLTPAACPYLQKISIDNTSVSQLDLSNNPELYILNISETRITDIDLSPCPLLQQFYAQHESAFNPDCKLNSLDLSHNPDLIYLFVNGNGFETLDISANTQLQDLFARKNKFTTIDLTHNQNLLNVMLSGNYMDFNTLPLVQPTWLDFDLTQKPFVVSKSCLVGSPIDFSAQVVLTRDDIAEADRVESTVELYSVPKDDPDTHVLVDPAAYTFENGILTVNELLADSIYAVFQNALWPNTMLSTTKFLMKDDENFGQKELAISLVASAPNNTIINLCVGIDGASKDMPMPFYVDFGDGDLIEFAATTSSLSNECNASGKVLEGVAVKIYAAPDHAVTAFETTDIALSEANFDNSTMLRELRLVNTALPQLSLDWNRCLERLTLNGNNFSNGISLLGANGSQSKTVLYHIDLSGNLLPSVQLANDPYAITYLDLSNNTMTEVNFTNYDNLQYLDISNNLLTELVINYCESLTYANCSNNNISSLRLPETNIIEHFDCANNLFDFSNLPQSWPTLKKYIYAPQQYVQIPVKGSECDLSSQCVTISGNPTTLTWKNIDGQTLTEGVDYTIAKGITKFLTPAMGKSAYCELTNAAFPALSGNDALRTNVIEIVDMPTNILGSFITPVGGQKVDLMFISDKARDAIYIDWSGNLTLTQYSMPKAGDRYGFEAITEANAKVTIYSYDKNPKTTFVRLNNAEIKDLDLSGFTNLYGLSCENARLDASSIVAWPNTDGLGELSLDRNKFTEFDTTPFTALNSLSLTGNKLTTLDISSNKRLMSAYVANNQIESITVDNPWLFSLDLSSNKLADINLAGMPDMYQLFLNNNRFSQIDLEALYALKELRVLYLDHNLFDFTTLPVPQSNWGFYIYGDQPTLQASAVNGVVDLSSQASRDGVETVYTWFYNYPEKDEETGELTGTILEEDVDYEIADGITTFLVDYDKVCCVLTNELFPATYLQTNLMAVSAAGICNISADSADGYVYNMQGMLIKSKATEKDLQMLPSGIYIYNGKKIKITH